MEDLASMLIRHEGLKLKMYKDSLGIATIGVGHNLQDKPITREAALFILNDDIRDVNHDLSSNFPWVAQLDGNRQIVLANMCFNLGLERFKAFKNTLRMVESGDYTGASKNMLDSKWASQVGKRATELAEIMKKGA